MPASLIANWKAEIARFAPSLRRGSRIRPSTDGMRTRRRPRSAMRGVDLVITTYGMLLRLDWLRERHWNAGDPGRGPGDQELRHPPDARREGAASDGPHRPDRHAGGEPAGRPVVAVRFPQSGPAGLGQGVRRFRQGAGEARAQSLRPAARAGAALHPAAAEDRQERSSPTCRTRRR